MPEITDHVLYVDGNRESHLALVCDVEEANKAVSVFVYAEGKYHAGVSFIPSPLEGKEVAFTAFTPKSKVVEPQPVTYSVPPIA